MKKPAKKPLRVSKLDKIGILFGNLSNEVTQIRHRVSQLERRVDSKDATIARETQLIREQFLLTHEWQERALRAEHQLANQEPCSYCAADESQYKKRALEAESQLAGMKADRDAAAKRSQEFREEDAGRAEKIRDILKPYNLHLVEPIGGVRELAKLVDHWREKFTEANEKAGAALKGLEEKDHWRSRALKAEAQEKDLHARLGKVTEAGVHFETEYFKTQDALTYESGKKPVSNVDTPRDMTMQEAYQYAAQSAMDFQVSCIDHSGRPYLKDENEACEIRMSGPGRGGPTLGKGKNWREACRAMDQYFKEHPIRKILIDFDTSTTPGLVGQEYVKEDAPRKEEQKPLRLLVEIVPKKDEKHGLKSAEIRECVTIAVMSGPSRINPRDLEREPAMSIKELPSMPTLYELYGIYWLACEEAQGVATSPRHPGLRAVVKACGLEPAE